MLVMKGFLMAIWYCVPGTSFLIGIVSAELASIEGAQ